MFNKVSGSYRSRAVARYPVFIVLFGPAIIAIHNYCNMTGQIIFPLVVSLGRNAF